MPNAIKQRAKLLRIAAEAQACTTREEAQNLIKKERKVQKKIRIAEL